jgi:hypothetical protein
MGRNLVRVFISFVFPSSLSPLPLPLSLPQLPPTPLRASVDIQLDDAPRHQAPTILSS